MIHIVLESRCRLVSKCSPRTKEKQIREIKTAVWSALYCTYKKQFTLFEPSH